MRQLRAALIVGGWLAVVWLLAACDPNARTFVVNASVDAVDAEPGDGVCETSTPGQCTLRAAVMEANATPNADTIHLEAGATYALALDGPGEDHGATGDLDVAADVWIQGAATIDGGGVDQVFDVRSGRLTVQDATITGGRGDVGGFRVLDGARLALNFVEVTGNDGLNGAGGIHALDAEVAIAGSAVAGNHGAGAGGVHSEGVLRLVQSTVSGNSGQDGAGGVQVAGAVAAEVQGVTVTENAGPVGGIAGPAALSASVVADQAAGSDCDGAATSGGYNADSDGTCLDGSAAGDLVDVDPALGALELHGTTRSHRPAPTSPLVDAIPVGAAGCVHGALDQHLTARPQDSDSDGEPACEIGAVETSPFRVNHGGDDVDLAPGDGVCQDASGVPGDCSLRAAIDEANAIPGRQIIPVDPDVGRVTLARGGIGEDGNQSGDLDVTDEVAIDAPGLTVDAGGLDRVVHVVAGHVDLTGVTLEGGGNAILTGGGVRIEQGASATISRSTIRDNRTSVPPPTGGPLPPLQVQGFACTWTDGVFTGCGGEGAGGAGIWSAGTLELVDSAVHDNSATGGGCRRISLFATYEVCWFSMGGGVYAVDATIRNSTVARNSVERGDGGGLALIAGDVASTYTTIVDNTVGNGAGAQIALGRGEDFDVPALATMSLTATIVAGAEPPWTNCHRASFGAVPSGGFNLVSDGSCLTSAEPSDLVDVEPLLDPLGDHGGPTTTARPSATSPAVDLVPVGAPGLCDGAIPTDQRGAPRPNGGGCDAGAVER